MGMTPRPSLPVDSASSCSIQLPSDASSGGRRRVHLSRPASAASPRKMPSSAPGFSASTEERQRSPIARASSRMCPSGAPARAAGTMPKCDSTENRPPMSGWFRKSVRNPCSWARASRELPGSVMATNCRPLPMRSQNQANWLIVSMVEPDLLATTTSVRERSRRSAVARTWSGCVLSSTSNLATPLPGPHVSAITSGPRLDPPIPSSSTWLRPSACAPLANEASSVSSAWRS